LLKDASKLIESLRAELFKSRAEKEQAESERIHAALKLAQMQSKLDDAKNALDAMAKDRRAAGVLQFLRAAVRDGRVRMLHAKGEKKVQCMAAFTIAWQRPDVQTKGAENACPSN